MKVVVKARAGVGQIEVQDAPKPKIKPREVLVQIKYCGICGTDLGLYEWRESARYRRGIPIDLPVIIGHEASGVVAEIGAEVPKSRGLKVGDRVASDSWGGCGDCYYCRLGYFSMCEGERKNIGALADGAMAEYCAIPYFSIYKIPDTLSFEEAAALQPFGVAIRGVETLARFKPGDDAAIVGPGAIGLFEALLMRSAGAGKIFVVGLNIDKKRLDLAQQLGFTVINAEAQNARDAIAKMTDGKGVDVVFDATSKGVPGEAIKLLKKVGQLVITAELEEAITIGPKEFNRDVIITKHLGRNPSCWYRGINLLATGRVDIKPIITHKFKIEDTANGFETLQQREGIKVLIVP